MACCLYSPNNVATPERAKRVASGPAISQVQISILQLPGKGLHASPSKDPQNYCARIS